MWSFQVKIDDLMFVGVCVCVYTFCGLILPPSTQINLTAC